MTGLGAKRGIVRGFAKQTLLAGAALTAFAMPAAADTLQDALSMAYTGNPNLLAARAQLRATDESVPIALSGWRPTIEVSGDVTRQRIETSSPSTPGLVGNSTFLENTSKQGSVTLSQPLFNGFATVAGTKGAEDTVYSGRAHLTGTEGQVLLQAATSYLDVLENQAVVELNMNNVQLLSRQLDATNDRFRVGELTRTDVAQAEASLEGAKAAEVLAEGTLQQVRAAYENVIGKPPENLVEPPIPAVLPAGLDAAVSTAIANNPNYLSADFAAKAADENITVVQAALLPSANLVAQWTKGWDTNVIGYRSDQAIAQAQVVVPLYQQGAEWARLRQAKDSAGQAHLLSDQARLDAKNAAITAWEAYAAATASIESFKSQVAASEISVEGLQRQQEVGSATILDVLIQEQNLLTARVNLVRSQHDQVVAAYQVLAATGQLTAKGIALNVPVYDPVVHYNNVKWQAFGSDSQADRDGHLGREKPTDNAAEKPAS